MGKCCKCCENTLNLGCFDPCGIQFEVGQSVPVGEAGQWALYLNFGRKLLAYRNELIEGQPINFLVGCINAYYTYTGYIEKPDGTTLYFVKDGIEYNCFQFSTQIEAKPGIMLNADSII